MDSANINTAEQNIAQVKTALKAFVENEKIAKMLPIRGQYPLKARFS